MIKKEAFEALIEREGIMDFIWARSYEEIPGSEVGLYHLANDRYGVVFSISPPVYAGPETEKNLSTFFKTNLPNKSSIQFFAFSSRNLTNFKKAYMATHGDPSNVGKQDILKELSLNKVDWIKKHGNKSLYAEGIDFRLRNFINLCAITIPKKDENGNELQKSEVLNIFTRSLSALTDFSPKEFGQKEYVRMLREILVPDNPLWDPPLDTRSYINSQVVDNSSTLVLENDTNTLGIGTMVSKKEFEKLQREDHSFMEDQDKKSGLWQKTKDKFFKKEDEKREAFTKWHAKVYTTKQYPEYNSLSRMLHKFYDYLGTQIEPEVPCQFFSNLTVYIENKEKVKKEVFENTQWNLWQTNSLGGLVRYLPELRDRARECEAINELLNDGEIPMSAMWSVVVMDSSLSRTTQYGERLKKKFMDDNWILQEESVIPHWIFLYSLPLQFEPFVLTKHSKRMNTLFTSNCASITPLMTGAKGFGSPALVYVDRAGQLAGVDIFSSSTNYNFTVVGSSGSGKSYAMADFFSQYLLQGTKIRVIDVGRSYLELCKVIGGQYIEFSEESNMCLNFFTNIVTDDDGQIHEDELQTIVPLVALMAMQSVAPEDSVNNINIPVIGTYISKAVTYAFEARHRNAGMEDIGIALEQIQREEKEEHGETDELLKKLIMALYPFTNQRGEFYRYFNGINNLKFESDFVVIELEEIDKKDLLKSVVLASISHNINNEFFLGDRSQKKILAIDEAWSIAKDKIVMRFLETMARRVRKYNGASGIITQSIGDFFKNDATRAIFESSATKIFLEQSSESIEIAQTKKEITMSEGLLNLLRSVKSNPPRFSELLIKQGDGGFFVGRLITDRVSHWIYTNHPKDVAVLIEISESLNVTVRDARLIKGYSEKNDVTLLETKVKLIDEDKLSGESYKRIKD